MSNKETTYTYFCDECGSSVTSNMRIRAETFNKTGYDYAVKGHNDYKEYLEEFPKVKKEWEEKNRIWDVENKGSWWRSIPYKPYVLKDPDSYTLGNHPDVWKKKFSSYTSKPKKKDFTRIYLVCPACHEEAKEAK